MTTPSDVLKIIKEKEVKYVDFRFVDTRGKEQHVTVPSHTVEEELFTDGKMFDGSSIAGWKGINESDMILMPDSTSAVIDPFYEETTLNLRCDVIEPATMQGYERDPRSLALRAEAYLKSTGIADTALFGPENEFFVFDSVKWHSDMNSTGYTIDSYSGAWNSNSEFADRINLGHRPGIKGGYFPVPPVDCTAGRAQRDVQCAGRNGPEGRSAPPRGGHRRTGRDRCRCRHADAQGGRSADPEVRGAERCRAATARRPPSCPSRWSATTATACTCTSRCRRPARHCSPATSTADCPKRRCTTSAASSSMPGRSTRSRNPGTNSYKRLVPGFEAPVMLAYSARNRSASIRIPWVTNPKARRIEVRFPDSSANPYFAFSAMMMAGLDGIQNKIHPGEPADKDLYDLEPEEEKKIPQVCSSLDQALEALDKDREFLTRGGVFTNDLIDAYIGLKMQEVTRFRMCTHPVELDMYYSL